MSWHTKQTATHAAKVFGMDPKTMVRLLRDAGYEIGQNKKYSLQEVVTAMTGDLEKEQIRETRGRADLRELEVLEKKGELVSLGKVQEMMTTAILPMRQRLNALPSEMASKTNSTDPEHARAQLNQWVDQALPLIREQLPTIKTEPKKKKEPKE